MARGLTLKLNVNIGSEDVLKLLQVIRGWKDAVS